MTTHILKITSVSQDGKKTIPSLKCVVLIRHAQQPAGDYIYTYDEFLHGAARIPSETVDKLMSAIDPHDVCNFQYTSGTTGTPKAAMLTHM
jgi:long-subunit acyl-CoA synthetase (AMP-forming)